MTAVVAPGTTFSGTKLIDSGRALSDAVQNGTWLDGGIAFLDTLGNAAAALTDPIGTLVSIGFGWVMEHLRPLSTWLEQLAGSEANVNAVAGQWSSAGAKLRETGAALHTKLGDLEGLSGGTIGAYVSFARNAAAHLGASGEWAQAASSGLSSASALVTRMQGVVKNAITKVIATAIEAMAVVAATLGLGMGYAIARVVMKVNEMVNKVIRPLTSVLRSVKALTGLVQQLRTVFDGTAKKAMSELQGETRAISIDAGAVVDASGATFLGNTAYDRLRQSGRIADLVDHRGTAVTPLSSNADASLTADGSTSGTATLGGAGALHLGSAGGGPGGSTLTGTSGGITGSGIAGNGIVAAGATVSSAGASSALTGGRPLLAGNPVAGTGPATRSGLGVRRRDLRVVIETDDAED
jgi:hypothetical protein